MSFLQKVKSAFGYTATNRLVNKEAEYRLYEKVSQELANGEKDAGVWTAAFTKSEGDEKKAEAKYIELMVQRYKDSIEAGLELEEILESNFEANLKRKEKEREAEKERERKRTEEEEKVKLRKVGVPIEGTSNEPPSVSILFLLVLIPLFVVGLLLFFG